ncbi:hypothetical protein [Amycolatopsis nigrescens]|uniref:hypothetical protein n=1 Tax=Amycolatopsis nigrescens TaxID=381445 RepID=UPI00037806A1|nr:hypothetical protein [Amycolatopsis nigrescens]
MTRVHVVMPRADRGSGAGMFHFTDTEPDSDAPVRGRCGREFERCGLDWMSDAFRAPRRLTCPGCLVEMPFTAPVESLRFDPPSR